MEKTGTTISVATGKNIASSSQLSMFNVLRDMESDVKLLDLEPEGYEDYNFAELYGHNIATNPVSKYADDIMKTGAWLPSR